MAATVTDAPEHGVMTTRDINGRRLPRQSHKSDIAKQNGRNVLYRTLLWKQYTSAWMLNRGLQSN